MLEELALKLLDRLEEKETELLTWGFVDGGFSDEELREAAAIVLEQADSMDTPDELLKLLRQRRLITDVVQEGIRIHRTRFAETVRLLARLRQLFDFNQWRTGPSLVADYRIAVRPRRYPPRDIPPAEALRRVEEERPLSAPERTAFSALLKTPDGKPLSLAEFQVAATGQFLRPSTGARGLIICAGTGTGKTLAFYLPCLVKMAGLLSAERWTQALAIYPRNELLKDQFSEAFVQARKLDPVAKSRAGRKIRIGAYFGPTPRRAEAQELRQSGWRQVGTDFTCPYLRCPHCEGEMAWANADLNAHRERLICRQCGAKAMEDELALTRQQEQQAPPDLLFTTTEMLNRHLSSGWDREVFGVGKSRDRAPHTLLLDEAHTYSGIHGAQVALLIRRWRYALRHPVQFVGLSATLTDPRGFFADLVGMYDSQVIAVDTGPTLVEAGREYQVVLRGDPVSGTSLLSTTIQSAMLLGRVMDQRQTRVSRRAYGEKIFLFTDDLDVTNRLYHNILDAEGRFDSTRPNPAKEPLAALRSRNRAQPAERLREGQNWKLCEEIGHPLDNPAERLFIGRTSSQDTGVDDESQVIVATAALEVGYNDPAVGAVIQHKAPRDAASFLQRKGRAGRLRVTRPWTLVVLSDYGRDRLAYQSYEQLFDPVLEKAALPIRNRYVLRMQAVYALMDWLAGQLLPNKEALWNRLGGPWMSEPGVQWNPDNTRKRLAAILEQILQDPKEERKLAAYLEGSLQITADEVRALLWEPPRGVLTAVLPTLWRRLERNWQQAFSGESENRGTRAPLPEFIPENLFTDLNVPEVQIRAPRSHGEPADESLSLAQALATMAPGKVSRRFAAHRAGDSHWIAPRVLVAGRQSLPVEEYCAAFDEVGVFQEETIQGVQGRRCVRPRALDLALVPDNVKPTSNARLDWKSQIFAREGGRQGDIPPDTVFSSLLQSVSFYLHNQRCPVTVRRFAVGSGASIQFKDGREAAVSIEFICAGGGPAAVGFEQDVDGIRFRCQISDELRERVQEGDGLPGCRTAYFRHRLQTDPALRELCSENPFRIDWLGQIYLSMLLCRAIAEQKSVPEAVESLRSAPWEELVQQTMGAIFQVVDVAGEDEEDPVLDEPGVGGWTRNPGRVHDAVRQLLVRDEVQQRLLELSAALCEIGGPEWDWWLTRRLKVTLGQALLQSCYQLARNFEGQDLFLDIDGGVSPPGEEAGASSADDIWITENMSGGGGILEEIFLRYSEDPRRFYLLAEMALEESDFEIVDAELTRLVNLARGAPEVEDAMGKVRAAVTHSDLDGARRVLMRVLKDHQMLLTRPVMASVTARVLRPGSSAETDSLLAELLRRWREEEERLGLDIDSRVFAYLASVDYQISGTVRSVVRAIGGTVSDQECYGILYGLLWPRGTILRERSLESYNRFCALPPGDPMLLRKELNRQAEYLPIDRSDWMDVAHTALALRGAVRLIAPPHLQRALRSAVLELVSQPCDTEWLRLYPYLAQLQRTSRGLVATLHIREVVQ